MSEASELDEETQQAVAFAREFKTAHYPTIKGLVDKHKALMGEVKTLQDRYDVLQKSYKALETKAGRPGMGPGGEIETKDLPNVGAYKTWLRSGVMDQSYLDDLPAEEQKTMGIEHDTTGGYLAPPEYQKEILKDVIEYSPIRNYAEIKPGTTKEWQQPMKTGSFAAQWVESEGGSRTETDGLRYGMFKQSSFEMYARVDMYEDNLEDSAFNLETELNQEFSEQFGLAEGAAFLNGTGFGQPEGITTSSNASIQTINSGSTTGFTADALIEMTTMLKEPYYNNAAFFMRRATLKYLLKLKDATGAYLFQRGNAGAGLVPTLYEIPIVYCADMPAVGSANISLVLADLKAGYRIYDRTDLRIKRVEDVSTAQAGTVAFFARKRVGGKVKRGEAIVRMPNSA